jgi:ornithine decarboxylase
MTPRSRPIEEKDWPAVVALETQAYSEIGLSEGRAVLQSRALASPSTCLVTEVDSDIAAYVLALPYQRFRYPALDLAEAETVSSTNLHLHDLVVGAEFRCRGLARQLEQRLARTARSLGYRSISLIAVAGSRGFWAACRYQSSPEVSVSPAYGPNAVYMTRTMPGIPPRE